MNQIKARTADNKAIRLSCEQRADLIVRNAAGRVVNTPAAVKARAVRMGLVLTGKRQ